MNTVADLPLSLRPETAWVEARERVIAYLRAHRLTDAARIDRLASDIVQIARAAQRPGVAPMVAVMATMEASLAAWIARQSDADEPDAALGLMRGRLALKLGDVPARWPAHFLREHAAPADLVNAMRGPSLTQGPAMRLTHMAPEIETVVPARRPKVRAIFRWAFVRLLGGTVIVLSLLGAAVAASLGP